MAQRGVLRRWVGVWQRLIAILGVRCANMGSILRDLAKSAEKGKGMLDVQYLVGAVSQWNEVH